jgi:hypothetical protein
MQTSAHYSLVDFKNIIFDGFNIVLPTDTISIITELALQVGSPTYIKTPDFTKKDAFSSRDDIDVDRDGGFRFKGAGGSSYEDSSVKKKKRNNRALEIVNDNDWDTLRTFQPTKIETKSGIDMYIDQVRIALNKMSDKNYIDQVTKIKDTLNQMIQENMAVEEVHRVGTIIFEIASNNRFYSKLYADVYSDLITSFEMMRGIFESNLCAFLELFKLIETADADKEYDRFCKVNKDNEKRKALSAFIVNLTMNKIIDKVKLTELAFDLLNQIFVLITCPDKKNEVDEMTENVAILYNKQLFEGCESKIDGKEFMECIRVLAHMKTKMYPSLSSKSIFKYMDMIEM